MVAEKQKSLQGLEVAKPTIVKNLEGKNMLVNQVGCYGINLGRIDFHFDADKNKAAKGVSIIV